MKCIECGFPTVVQTTTGGICQNCGAIFEDRELPQWDEPFPIRASGRAHAMNTLIGRPGEIITDKDRKLVRNQHKYVYTREEHEAYRIHQTFCGLIERYGEVNADHLRRCFYRCQEAIKAKTKLRNPELLTAIVYYFCAQAFGKKLAAKDFLPSGHFEEYAHIKRICCPMPKGEQKMTAVNNKVSAKIITELQKLQFHFGLGPEITRRAALSHGSMVPGLFERDFVSYGGAWCEAPEFHY
jgi:hypothetical protein